MLVVAGYSVVVVTQNKDATDKVTSRTIDHVSSPGTYFEAEGALTVRAEEQCMVGMYIEPYTYQPKDSTAREQQRWYVAISAFNINTGEAVSTEAHLTLIDDRAVCDAIQPFLSMYPSAEAVVWWCADQPHPVERGRGRPVRRRRLGPALGAAAPAEQVLWPQLGQLRSQGAAGGCGTGGMDVCSDSEGI